MTMPRELTHIEWTAFHTPYLQGNTALCPSCGTAQQSVLKPLDRSVHFSCGHQLAIPENTETLTQSHSSAR